MTFPVGSTVDPLNDTIAVSVTGVPGETAPDAVSSALGVVVMDALQRANWPRTKSFSVAVVDVDDRVSEATREALATEVDEDR